MKSKRWLLCSWFLLFAPLLCWQDLQAQANIQVRVLWVRAHNNVDCDGFPSGDSDFVWEFIGTDNTIGRTNNNPSALGGLLGDFNHAYVNGNNGPYCHGFVPSGACGTVSIQGSGGFNPGNGFFFNHDYVCPGDVPTNINLRWRAYENDEFTNYSLLGLLTDGETDLPGQAGNPVIAGLVPTLPGSSGPIFATATSTDGGCPQTYSIAFEVIRSPLVVNAIPDNICNATQIPVDGTVRRFAWCPDATLEPGEPHRNEVTQNRSRWFYFVAPASGRVDISTDHGGTDFGTYFEIYHAADGAGCTAGLQPITGALVKNKFQYLSYVDFADNGGFANLGSQADITFDDCASILSSNPLVAGETYYIQMTTDDPNERGYIAISISSLSGSAAEPHDIPCRGATATVGTAVRTFGGGQPESASVPFGCATDRETGNFYAGNDPTRFQAYDYNHPATNNGNVDESVWVRFTAPNSGRIYMEGNVRGLLGVNEPENTALFGFDNRFAPGRPAEMLCSNLTNLNAADGGTGLLSANPTAIINQSCLEPGYTYYGMIDPGNAATGSDARMWLYDPSVSDPNNNPPGNDILCLSLLDTLYRVPVQPFNITLPFNAVAGSNVRACRETLAGEPASNPNAALRADQTVWHYFTAPGSGVVDIRLRAYIGMQNINYAIYPLLNGTDCYGGLRPATYTTDGTRSTLPITPIAQGRTDFNGTTVSLCCLVPGTTYAIQVDGGAPGDQGQYIIEFIEEIEVYAGDSRYVTQDQDTINYNSNDTAFICFGDTIIPGVMLNPLGQSTTRIPGCISVGFVMHNTLPIPNPIANAGFTYIDSVRLGANVFVNNTNGSGSFSNPLFNTVYYVSALADETATWGQLVCESASMENGAPVVFLRPINISNSYDPNACAITFSVTGGVPGYRPTATYNYVVTNSATGDTLVMGAVLPSTPVVVAIPVVGTYNIFVTDGSGCEMVAVVNATPCNNPCITNPVRITPDPLNNSIYSCLPGGTTNVTLQFNGGAPTVNGSAYTVEVSGSSVTGQNGTRSQTPVGGAVPTPFTFQVADGDSWTVIVRDANGCADTVSATFIYNIVNCPNYCQLNPITTVSTYDCLPNRAALVQLTIGGGQPSLLGTNYLVTVSGSTVFGQSFSNAQVQGVIGGTVNLSFLVNDGDNWTVIVRDSLCSDTLTGNYVFNSTNCPNLCQLLPVNISPDPINSTVYNCQGNGTATVSLNLSGGAPANFGGNFTVTVSGSSVAGQNGTRSNSLGLFTFTVRDGDNWQVIVRDTNNCADTATGTFVFNLLNCPNICQLLPLDVTNPRYVCNANGTATATVDLSGGKPSYNGSNYTVQVLGSTAGGNTAGTAVAGIIGGTAQFSFPVGDGDNWTVIVTDQEGCSDTLRAQFTFNLVNCPNICQLRPIQLFNGPYTCNLDGTASVEIRITGGQPSYDGSNYRVTVNGSSTGSNAFDLAVPGTINDTTRYTITIRDGDTWQVIVRDTNNCNDDIQGTFVWNASNCANICNDPAYTAIQLNSGNGFTYDCDGQGNALVNFEITGGLPQLDGGNSPYTALVTRNGQTNVQLVNSNGTLGSVSLSLNNGDSWSIVVFDNIGCDSVSISTTVFNSVNAVATTDATAPILIGQFANLDGASSTGNISSYRWTPTTNVTNPTAAVTPVQPTQTTIYTLEVTDNLGCTDQDTVEVPVGPCVPEHAGFTPNGDGTNDTWTIPCLGLFPGDLQVYNRWGQLVYQMDNYDGTWNGKHQGNGQDLPDATYYYVLTVTFPNLSKPVVYKGTVTIIR